MRIAVLIKQVPALEQIGHGANGRLERENVGSEINPFCRRAISKGVEIARQAGGTTTVLTLGPPRAADALREALAWGADDAVLISDQAFAGSDTLATARALVRALQILGPFDLVLLGRNSVDADTGQVGPEVAQLLGLPFLPSVRRLAVEGDLLTARGEHDNGWVESQVRLPAVLSCAERLCQPAKVPVRDWMVPETDRIRLMTAADLGEGPWGEGGSPTRVGAVREIESQRAGRMMTGSVEQQVAAAVTVIRARASAPDGRLAGRVPPPAAPPAARTGREVTVLAGPNSPGTTRELLGAAAVLASTAGGRVTLLDCAPATDAAVASSWGADGLVRVGQARQPDEFAAAATEQFRRRPPWAVLIPGTIWGREAGARIAAALGAGLTGDAIGLECVDGRLVAWKPAFGSRVVAAVTSHSETQMVTVRPGVFGFLDPRPVGSLSPGTVIRSPLASRVRELSVHRDDQVGVLAGARAIVGIGAGVAEHEISLIEPLRALLGAKLGSTRRVTDRGSLPHSRQIGITGHSVTPELYLAVGISGKFNHMVGVRGARTVVAVNSDPAAPVFGSCDVGIVGDWHEVVPALVAELSRLGPGSNVECGECRAAVLVVTGGAAQMWCHGIPMRMTRPLPCSEPTQASIAGGMVVGAMYADPASSSIVRCIRSGSGWPRTSSGELTRLVTAPQPPGTAP